MEKINKRHLRRINKLLNCYGLQLAITVAYSQNHRKMHFDIGEVATFDRDLLKAINSVLHPRVQDGSNNRKNS